MDERKRDQTIRSEGAENYVRAVLMMEFGIITSVASRNMPGYDLIAHNLKNRRTCKISVKFRTAANADGFRFTEQKDFDFLVAIIGNRGLVGDDTVEVDPRKPLQSKVFIFPRRFVLAHLTKTERLLKNPLRKRVPSKYKRYQDKWHLITDFLRIPVNRKMRK